MANNVTRWRKEDPPNLLLAIDPGASYPGRQRKEQVPYAGCALFQGSELVWAALVKCPTIINKEPVAPFARPNTLVKKVCAEAGIARFKGTGETLNVLAVENPLIYRRGKARPADVVALARIYGAFMGGIDSEFYTGPSPQEWKGNIEGKEIVNERVCKVLNASERICLMEAQRSGHGGLSDHVLDAVGLGLFALGRADVGMVI